MQIKGISITNYRSIKKANYIPIENKCVIIGPNNEGKSNILQGIVLSLTKITGSQRKKQRIYSRRLRYFEGYQGYDWDRDFPLDLQEIEKNGKTIFKVRILLDEEEENDLSEILNSPKTNELEFILSFSKDKESIEVNPVDKKIKYTKNEKMDEILNFFHERLIFHYIPAIRPTEYSVYIIEELLEERLEILKNDKAYQDLLQKILEYQKPVLEELGHQLTDSIKSFIPEVKNVEISNDDEINRILSHSLSVLVDDNVKTDIEHKGDGIKSLLAISLVNHSVHQQAEKKSILLALEEPESHLHPGAIHRLNQIITSISKTQQVIITTHSPLLVDRTNVEHNIIVNKQAANQALKVIDIRDTIGVHISDNLTNTSWVLLVEGKSDEKILRKWLSEDTDVKNLLDNNYLSIESLGGGSNFSYKINLFNSMLCSIVFFLDNDQCGISSFEDAKQKSLVTDVDGTFAIVQGYKESEIEDMIEVEVYSDIIYRRYGVQLAAPKFKNSKKKWSNKVCELFKSSGKLWNDKIEDEIKEIVADALVAYKGNGIKMNCLGPVQNLIDTIKSKIKI